MIKRFSVCRCIVVKEKQMEYITQKGVSSVSEVVEVARQLGFADLAEEYFGIICLNAKGEINHYHEVSHGDLISSVTNPREIFKRAMLSNAASIVLIHLHPSGNPTASECDIEATKRIAEVGHIIGIPVIDHVIIGEDYDYYSMKAKGDF